MKFSFILVFAGLLLSSGCAGKKIYDERGYLFNPSGVWGGFNYQDYDSYDEATTALRARLTDVWNIRYALGRYTKSGADNVSGIVDRLVPGDGMAAHKGCPDGSKGVVLLLHGLYDSPYVMKDIGGFFNEQCYHSRFLLLPGHGTVPGDLRGLKYGQWVDAVETVVKQTRDEYEEEKVIIAGFSTGGGLALDYASDNAVDVQALFLFAPLVDLSMGRVFGAGLVETLGEYVQKGEEMDTFKYESVTANSVLQVNRLAKEVSRKLRNDKLKMPVFIAQAKNDYTLSSRATIDLFNEKAFGADSVFLLYSPMAVEGFTQLSCDDIEQDNFADTSKVICNSSFMYTQGSPEATIDDYSHMSLILSPVDSHYGINGRYRYCLHYREGADLTRCRTGGIPEVCFGERDVFRGSHVSKSCLQSDSVIIRLTSNPKFEHLKSQLVYFMKKQKL